MTVSISETTLTDGSNRVFDLSNIFVREDGSFVAVLKHPVFGDLPYQVTQDQDSEVWTAVNEWRGGHEANFEAEAAETTEAAETYEGQDGNTEAESVEADPDRLFRETQNTKLRQLANRFKAALDNAYIDSSLGFRADADANAERNVSGLVTLLSDTPSETTVFCDYDNIQHEISLSGLKVLQREIIKNTSKLYQQKWGYRDSIENAQSSDELKGIKIAFKYLTFN